MTGSHEADVKSERHGDVLLLRLSRVARHNAIGGTMLRDLAEAFDEAAADDSVHVVVTTGAGGAFSVGADAADLGTGTRSPARELLTGEAVGGDKGLPPLSGHGRSLDDLGNAGRWTLRMWQLGKPTIAAVNGTAVGGGFGIEAKQLGLVTEMVPDDRLLDRAMEVAQRISSMPPLGVQSSKRLLRRSMGTDLTDQLRAEHAAQLMLFDHPDTHAALDRLTAGVKRARHRPRGGDVDGE